MQNQILDAVETFYASVGDVYNYKAALEAYSAAADDTAVVCTELNPLTRRVIVHAAHNIDLEAMAGWSPSEMKCESKDLLIKAVAGLPLYIPTMRRTFVPDSVWEQSKLFQRVSAPWGYHSDGTSILSKGIARRQSR